MKVIKHVPCPYCQFSVKLDFDTNDVPKLNAFFCDSDIGGCGRDFIVYAHLSIECRVKRIED